jgi:hypothetical protein
MNKKLLTIILGVGMGFGSIGAASAGSLNCHSMMMNCLGAGVSMPICLSVFNNCLGDK